MIEFSSLEGKTIKLIDTDGEVFEGFVGDYIYPDDNEPEGVEGLILDYPLRNGKVKMPNLIQFNAPEIKSVEIIGKK